MRTLILSIAVFTLLPTPSSLPNPSREIRAGQVKSDPNAKDIINRAIEAHGGKALLSKTGFTTKLKYTWHGEDKSITTSGFFASQGRTKYRLEINEPNTVEVVNTDKGWQKANGIVRTLEKAEIDENLKDNYADWIGTLIPLRNNDLTITLLSSVKVNSRPAHTIRVSCQGMPDVDLCFDSETLFIVKRSFKLKYANGTEKRWETYSTDIQLVGGIRWPMRWESYVDGKKRIEGEYIDFQFFEQVDEKHFARPD